MAILHTANYHEDTTARRPITKEDVDFLRTLQTEMNTQDTVGQAAPRFWVIKDYKKTWNDEGDNPVIFALQDYDEDGLQNLKEVADHINNSSLRYDYRAVPTRYGDPCTDPSKVNLLLIFEFNGTDEEFCEAQKGLGPEIDAEIETMEDAYDWLTEKDPANYQLRYWSLTGYTAPDTLFLTLKDAQDHLLANHYNYHKQAHAFAMTAWRSPVVEKLYEILEHVDFTDLVVTPSNTSK